MTGAPPPFGPGYREIAASDPATAARRAVGARRFAIVAGVGGLLVGLFAILYGLLFWPAAATVPWPLPVGLGVFLLAGTAAGYGFLRRTVRQEARQVLLGDPGFAVTRVDGSRFLYAWDRPDFAIDITSTRPVAPGSDERIGLEFVRGPRAFAPALRPDDVAAVLSSARVHGLAVTERRSESPAVVMVVRRIRSARR